MEDRSQGPGAFLACLAVFSGWLWTTVAQVDVSGSCSLACKQRSWQGIGLRRSVWRSRGRK